MIELTASDALTQAVRLAMERRVLPLALGSAEIQEMTQRLRERLFFSARTANVYYLNWLKERVERYVQGEGRDNDLAQLRIEARLMLARLGYTPEGGFPGDDELGIPPATAGSLQDLSSERRLNLVYQTQAELARGLGLKLRGIRRMELWPAWELVRVAKFDSEHQREWLARWKKAADEINWAGVSTTAFEAGRMAALKTSPLWAALGSTALFADALNTDHPPFAFSSGMGWRELTREQTAALGLAVETEAQDNAPAATVLQMLDASAPAPQPPAADRPVSETERQRKLAMFQKIKQRAEANKALYQR
ncbi:MAG: hypothetical protein ACO1TE_29135 [Prosthecobacter sp.]